MAIFDDLEAEQDRLEEILGGLVGQQWTAPSAAPGWSVADVVLHLAGLGPQEVRCDLTAPDGVTSWELGPRRAGSVISGAAGAFCRVAAQRLPPEESGLSASGPHAATAVRLLRSYAA